MVVQLQMSELSNGISTSTDPIVKKVLEGILNDFMDLQFEKETPYTTGQRVLPMETTIQDVDTAFTNEADSKYKAVFQKISQTFKSGDKTPQTNDGGWNPKFKPILVLVTANELI